MEKIYKSWEKDVINNFYTKGKSNTLKLPEDNAPLYAYKNKVNICINFIENGVDNATRVENGDKDLYTKKYIKLYHIGEQKINKTSSGLQDNDFFYPAIDSGGLTNYKQQLGTKSQFLDEKFLLTKKVKASTIDAIYKTWKKYAGKTRFYGNLKNGLTKAINSIKSDCYIQFIKVPLEYRVVVTSNDVYKKVGKYYNRIYGSDKYAKEVKPNNKMYCGIATKYITPDINKNNVLNEYIV